MIKGRIKSYIMLCNGFARRHQQIESLAAGHDVVVPLEILISPGLYELDRIENPWFPRDSFDSWYAGDWLVIRGTMTGLTEIGWRRSPVLEVIEDD